MKFLALILWILWPPPWDSLYWRTDPTVKKRWWWTYR